MATIPMATHPINAQVIRDVDNIQRKLQNIERGRHKKVRRKQPSKENQNRNPSVEFMYMEENVPVHEGPFSLSPTPHMQKIMILKK